jgi:hypothetical protein
MSHLPVSLSAPLMLTATPPTPRSPLQRRCRRPSSRVRACSCASSRLRSDPTAAPPPQPICLSPRCPLSSFLLLSSCPDALSLKHRLHQTVFSPLYLPLFPFPLFLLLSSFSLRVSIMLTSVAGSGPGRSRPAVRHGRVPLRHLCSLRRRGSHVLRDSPAKGDCNGD